MTLELLSDRVAGLEKSKSEWEALCREMLSTITLEGNKEHFSHMPEDWHVIVDSWVKRFHELCEAEKIGEFCCQHAEKMNQLTNPDVVCGSDFVGKCAICGNDELYSYHVPEYLWRKILPERLWNEIVCGKCFHSASLKISSKNKEK